MGDDLLAGDRRRHPGAGGRDLRIRALGQSGREVAEQSLLIGLRPLLGPTRPDDPAQQVFWGDGFRVTLGPGQAEASEGDGGLYLAFTLGNVGSGLAVLHGWYLQPGLDRGSSHPDPSEFRQQRRDLYIPPGDIGFWQARIRGPDGQDVGEGTPLLRGETPAAIRTAVRAGEPLTVHLLYGDYEGGQLTVSRFAVMPREGGGWSSEVGRHWRIEGPDPRPRDD